MTYNERESLTNEKNTFDIKLLRSCFLGYIYMGKYEEVRNKKNWFQRWPRGPGRLVEMSVEFETGA